MRIYNNESNQVFDSIDIFLTLNEAKEMQAVLEHLINNPNDLDGVVDEEVRISDFVKQVHLIVYTPENIRLFHKDSKYIVEKDSAPQKDN